MKTNPSKTELFYADGQTARKRHVFIYLYSISSFFLFIYFFIDILFLFGFVGTDQIRAKIIIDNEKLDQVSQFTYLGCSISYQCSNDVELKLAKFLQLIGPIKGTIFRKVRTETIRKLYNTLVLPTFLYGSENWTLTA